MTTTDHSVHIARLRSEGERVVTDPEILTQVDALLADLLELHDATGISLDNWPVARRLVERRIGGRIQENYV